jgi:predicted nucleic acid-binding protein
MIGVDTGPWVALFDPRDAMHLRAREVLRSLQEKLFTTVPVLTEAFHMLSPDSPGAHLLRDFILKGGCSVWWMDQPALERAFELMNRYADHPMDLADASLVVAAEVLDTQKIFTLDRGDFSTYRIQRGHQSAGFDIIG